MNIRSLVIMAVILACVAGFYFWDASRLEDKKQQEEQTKRMFDMPSDTIDRIELDRSVSAPSGAGAAPQPDARETILLEKHDGEWSIAAPLAARADQTWVRDFLGELVGPVIERRVESYGALSDFGLDPPTAHVTLRGSEGKTVTALLGARSAVGHEIYAKLADQDGLLMIDAAIEPFLTKGVREMRDHSVLDFAPADVRKLEISRSGERLTLEKRDDQWFIVGDPQLPGDRVRIDDMLTELQAARLIDFVDEQPTDLSSYGLSEPHISVTVWLGETMAQKQLLIGTQDPALNYYARGSVRPNVFTVRKNLADTLSKSPNDLRDRSVLSFDRDDVAEIRIDTGGIITVMALDAADDWRMIEPAGMKAEGAEVSAFLSDLSYLRAVDFLAAVPDGLTPAAVISLTQPEAAQPSTLTVFQPKTKENRYVATVTGGVGALTLSEKDAEKLMKKPDDFRNKVFSDYTKRDLRRLEIVRGEETTVIEGDGEAFTGSGKDNAELSNEVIEDLIWSFDFVKLREFVAAAGEDLTAYGLDKPGVTVNVTKADGTSFTLLIGNALPGGGAYYVKRQDLPEIGIAERAVFGTFFPTPPEEEAASVDDAAYLQDMAFLPAGDE